MHVFVYGLTRQLRVLALHELLRRRRPAAGGERSRRGRRRRRRRAHAVHVQGDGDEPVLLRGEQRRRGGAGVPERRPGRPEAVPADRRRGGGEELLPRRRRRGDPEQRVKRHLLLRVEHRVQDGCRQNDCH